MRHPLTALALAASLLLPAAQANAATQTITFDDLAPGTTLSTQYAGIGATFSPNAYTGAGTSSSGQNWAHDTDMTVVSATGSDTDNLGTPSLASGNVLGSYNGWSLEDGDPSFTIAFSTPMSSVSADFAAVATGSDVAIYAYDGSTLVGSADGGANYGQFMLSVAAADITSVVITPGSYDDYVAVDNISYTSAVPEPANLALTAFGLAALAWRGRRSAAKTL